ncbi:B12-binding domain-containing radical SAM protein [Patescibacteria group bacterium]|nr:B12-binding domain-containing radical SAM protein [Patescibacteria group bacterium]
MKILFIYSLNIVGSLAKPLESPEQIQFGISYISSFLKKHGHQTRMIVLSRTSPKNNRHILDEYLKKFSPELICFTAVSTEYQFIANIAKYIKEKWPNIYLLVGGPYVSLNPNGILSDGFDALCVGEGENPALELVSQLEKGVLPSTIPNLWIKRGSEIEKNLPRPFLQDLDSLPFPDREMWQEWTKERPGARYSVLLGRGCPFQCTYCSNHALKKLASGSYVRFRSPDNIIEEIKDIIARFPMQKREIYLEVESFGVDKKWAIELCSKLESFNKTVNQLLSFGVNLRIMPNADFEDLLVACKKANFRFINIGLESGSERVRREILKRNYSNKDVVNTVSLARKHSLKVAFYNMVGLPGETVADFKETVEINRTCLPDWHLTGIFFPYPGTDLYFLCKEKGLLKESSGEEIERMKATLDLPGFNKKQIQRNYIWFDYYVYNGLKPMHKILGRVLRAYFMSKPYSAIFWKKLLRLPLLRSLRERYGEY